MTLFFREDKIPEEATRKARKRGRGNSMCSVILAMMRLHTDVTMRPANSTSAETQHI